jgi:protein tyrosine/serine phosphatase
MSDTPEQPRCCCCRGTRIALWIGAIILIAGGGTWGYVEFFKPYHLATVQEGVLYRDGVQNLRKFELALDKVKPKTVVSLIDDQELADPAKPQFAKEMELLKQQGVKVVRIPVKLGGWPTTDDVRKFLNVAQAKENQPVLVHCAQGVRRTGMMVAAYQESVLGFDDAKAKAELLNFGHSQRTTKDVERFIQIYDAKAMAVTAQLETSNED